MPDKITNVEGSLEVYYLKKYFKPLSINKDGLCPFCENKFKKIIYFSRFIRIIKITQVLNIISLIP